jgi:hypothetical protein
LLSGVVPPEESGVTSLLTQPVKPNAIALRRSVFEPAAAMILGSLAGEDTVPDTPLSPEEATTVTPASTAASLAA